MSYRPPIVRGRGGHGRGRHSGGRGSHGNGGHQISRGGGRAGATTAQHGRGNRQTEKLAKLYISEIIRLQGVPPSIISDREFSYNNNYHSSIDMGPFGALYWRICRSPIGWFDAFEEKLLATQNRQKQYTDRKVRDLDFMEGEQVLMKVLPMKGVMRFGKRGNLSPWYIGLFEVPKHVGEVAYELALPPGLLGVHPVFHVSMLKKYHGDGDYIIRWDSVLLEENLSYEEEPVAILDRKVRKLSSSEIASIKVQWKNRPVEESTWEKEVDEIPCAHAFAVFKKKNIIDIHPYYKPVALANTYEVLMIPMPDRED
ncbi:uncharacterized protein [Solanum lycopersicum]|uniref:uncharacterized protein n=1 Tax=Solanum lycopersicum TaxID=4081 RepID=UPI00374A91DC